LQFSCHSAAALAAETLRQLKSSDHDMHELGFLYLLLTAPACILQPALQTQDDTGILSDTFSRPASLGYAPAVTGNSQAKATDLTINVISTTGGPSGTGISTGSGTGLVIQPEVVNFFNFTASAGAASITVKVSELGTAQRGAAAAVASHLTDMPASVKQACTAQHRTAAAALLRQARCSQCMACVTLQLYSAPLAAGCQ
jgi:hypothetical protein